VNDKSPPLLSLPEHGALIGTAGWSLPRAEQSHFPEGASHLERYAARFAAVEINSSFHRSHKPAIWARWRDAVPETFRFSVKMPKTVTHTARLAGADELVATFLEEASRLGSKLACILVQLPPSLAFDGRVAAEFFEKLRERTAVSVACEPRHVSWFADDADALLAKAGVARVAADPALVPAAGEPGGSRTFSYFRLHGSPRIYYSAYADEFIAELAQKIIAEQRENRPVWCIFDNTTLGAATRNALDLSKAVGAVR
jgi:uncharacterized protein YecE (DUF72 family)